MREIFELASSLSRLMSIVGELASPEPIDLSEIGGFEVGCDTDFTVGELKPVSIDYPLMGLDSHSRIIRFLGVDVHLVTGALVGGDNVLIPQPNGTNNVRWIGLKLRFKPRDYELLDKLSEMFYIKSSFLDNEYFVGSYNDEAVRDEVRNHVEVTLMRAVNNNAFLLVDGPVFPTPRVLSMEGNKYASVFNGIIESRVKALNGLKAVGVVKRIEHSHFLARYLRECGREGVPMVDDYTLAIKRATLALPNSRSVYLGPIVVKVGNWVKYCWYVVTRTGRNASVVRVEGLSEEVAKEGRDYVGMLMTLSGTAVPIHIADKLARRLNASAVLMLYNLSPGGIITYEGLEEVERARGDLVE
ncbi:DNA double-strand break repair nuclease NurA [Caldivirga maquilingensis]|uniref:NurA domain-containing protein n=1 Tax=Caldivirga maquilingensis (strain ATCC 700844 / DSM 13496 / JCM 10307 / IC-167) TaxID=397948 RepID=A8M9B6_CALMQ|nr:DNA double-strand break repair nuclease NurA [Caldivirga maquilingensis]ABW02335.1 conserved hypothetical protein [Caldivirga maquilingensis IC-167]